MVLHLSATSNYSNINCKLLSLFSSPPLPPFSTFDPKILKPSTSSNSCLFRLVCFRIFHKNTIQAYRSPFVNFICNSIFVTFASFHPPSTVRLPPPKPSQCSTPFSSKYSTNLYCIPPHRPLLKTDHLHFSLSLLSRNRPFLSCAPSFVH